MLDGLQFFVQVFRGFQKVGLALCLSFVQCLRRSGRDVLRFVVISSREGAAFPSPFFFGGRSIVSMTSSCLRSHSIWLTVSETWLISSRIRSRVFTDSSMSASDPGDAGIAQDGERLGVGLAFDFQAHGVFPRSHDGTDLGRFGSPVRDRPRVGIAEARFVPDVRVVGRQSSQRNQSRRLIAKVPFHTIHAGATLRFEFSDHLAFRVQNFKLDRILRLRS